LVVRASQAGRAELVVFLHDLLKFVSRAADHLAVIVVVVKRATCSPVQDSLIKLTAPFRVTVPEHLHRATSKVRSRTCRIN